MDHAEMISKLVLEAVLPGARLEYRVEQSHGEYDFDLRYGGTLAAVEVTESAIQHQKWMSAKISKKEGGSIIAARHCKKSWIVFAMDPKTIPVIRKKADECLAKVEQAGFERFNNLDACTARRQREAGLDKVLDPPVPRCVEDVCCELKIQFGSVIPEETSPKIYIRHPVRGGAVGPSVATEAGEREAGKKDNQKKLGAANTEGRHLVVYVGIGLPWIALTEPHFDAPTAVPKLPPEITHIWLIGNSGRSNEDEFVVWRASTKEPWRSQRVVVPHMDSAVFT